MKWIGQHIYDFISRFRSDVYLEAIESGTIASGGNLGLDSNNKIVKASEVGGSVDLTSEVSGVLPVANGGTGASSLTDNSVLTGTGTSAITAEANFTYNGTALSVNALTSTFTNATSSNIYIKNTGNNTSGGTIQFFNERPTGVDGDDTGVLKFWGMDDGGVATQSAQITTELNETANGDECGSIHLKVANDDNLYNGISILSDKDTAQKIDVTIGNGATSMTTIAGDLDIDGDKITTAGNIEIETGGSGTITLDSTGAITLERGSSTVEVPDVTGTLQVVDLVQYLLPSDFIVNDASFVRGYLYAADDAGSDYGGTWQDGGIQAWAWYQIPKGFKVTHMHAYGSTTSSTDASIYQLDPTDGTRGSALASGTWNVNRTLSAPIESHDEKVALVVLDPNAATDIVYSVKLTLALV